MKKAVTFIFALASINATAADFTFTGEIQDITCEVNTNFKNLVIVLPTVSQRKFVNNKTAGFTPFYIELDNCRNLTDFHQDKQLYAFFESDYLDSNNEYTLQNVATKNQARNVNIQLTNSDGSAIKISNDATWGSANFDPISSYSGGDKLSSSKQSYRLSYGAQYYATGAVGAGDVESFATFTIRYK